MCVCQVAGDTCWYVTRVRLVCAIVRDDVTIQHFKRLGVKRQTGDARPPFVSVSECAYVSISILHIFFFYFNARESNRYIVY